MKILLHLIPLLVLIIGQVPTALASDNQQQDWSLDEVLQNIKDRGQSLETFIANFKQIQNNRLFVEKETSQGILYYHHSGKLLMEMTVPEKYLLFISDHKMILGVPGTPAYRQKKMPRGMTSLEQMVGLDQSLQQLKQRFKIRMVCNSSEKRCEINLIPTQKRQGMPFDSIKATFNTHQWLPQMIELHEVNGDSTAFYLEYVSINQPLPDNIFDIPKPDTDHPNT